MNTDLNLDSAVELVFRTDYVPLDRLAGGAAQERIKVNTLNPEVEAKRIADERVARETARATERSARSKQLDSALKPPPPLPPSSTGVKLDQLTAAAADKATGGGTAKLK